MAKKLTNNEFINKARKVHGEKYDYSLVDYVNGRTHVDIVCPKHGLFRQWPQHHVTGKSGCPKCGIDRGRRNRRSSTQQFVSKARKVHGEKYDYSLVDYESHNIPVVIKCPIHHKFTQTPRQHLQGHGCRKCSVENNSIKRRNNTTTLINNARKVHGGKYDYSLVDYKPRRIGNKITIICPIHGKFIQNVGDHLNGHGCPKCGSGYYNDQFFKENLEEGEREGYLYLMEIQNEHEHFIKIGITKNLPNVRKTHIPKYHVNIITYIKLPLKQAYETEQQTLTELTHLKHIPQIKFGGHTECLDFQALDIVKYYFKQIINKRY